MNRLRFRKFEVELDKRYKSGFCYNRKVKFFYYDYWYKLKTVKIK